MMQMQPALEYDGGYLAQAGGPYDVYGMEMEMGVGPSEYGCYAQEPVF